MLPLWKAHGHKQIAVEMADSESIHKVVNQAAVQAATVVIMA